MSNIVLTAGTPPAGLFAAWRNTEGWGELSEQHAEVALSASVASICAYHDQTLIGFGRAVGDGVMYAYLQDVIVDPAWRNRDVGRRIISSLLCQLEDIYPAGATIGLMSARGRESFYERLGFIRRPNESYGAGMIRVL